METLHSSGSESYDPARNALWEILNNITQQLQFAEAKNGALLTINFALVVAIGTMLSGSDISTFDVRAWLFTTSIGLSGAALISLMSFLPHIGGDTEVGTKGKSPNNLVYFKSLATAGIPELQTAVFIAVRQSGPASLMHISLCHQIIVNSGIAVRKFSAFKIATIVTVGSAILPTTVIALTWVGNGGMFK